MADNSQFTYSQELALAVHRMSLNKLDPRHETARKAARTRIFLFLASTTLSSADLPLFCAGFGQLEIAADDPALWTVLTQIALSGLTWFVISRFSAYLFPNMPPVYPI